MLRNKYISVFCLCGILTGFAAAIEPAEEQEIITALSTKMNSIRHKLPDNNLRELRKKYGTAIVPYLEQYMSDSHTFVRWIAYAEITTLIVDCNDMPLRKRIVDKLVVKVRDDDRNRAHLSRRLLKFQAADFSDKSKDILGEKLTLALDRSNNNIPSRDIILLVGAAGMKSELPRLKQFLDKNQERFEKELQGQSLHGSLSWTVLRARARMGVKEDIQRCIELAESNPDEWYKATTLLANLAYIRQPDTVGILYKYLKSNKLSPYMGKDVVTQRYAGIAAGHLSHILRGYPSYLSYRTPDVIEQCRKWMAEQKKWDIIR